MSEALLTVIVSGLFGSVAGVTIAWINTRASRDEIDRQRKQIEALTKAQERARKDIMWIGVWLDDHRDDGEKIVVLFNQMFRQFEKETGRKPEIDFELFAQMKRFAYKSGPLGPLEIK